MEMSPSSVSTSQNKNRIDLLDGWRTLAVLSMVVWHFFWDLSLFHVFPTAEMQRGVPLLLRYCIVCSFVFLAGMSSRFSHNNLRRGLITIGWALAVTGVTYLVGDPAWFGILHLLGCCMLLYAAVGHRLEQLPARTLTALWLTLFAALWLFLDGRYVEIEGLWALGLRTREFSSSDYYPLLPWGCLFFAGAAAGGAVRASTGAWRSVRLPTVLTWPGRHALVIYLAHQPVFYVGMLLTFQ